MLLGAAQSFAITIASAILQNIDPLIDGESKSRFVSCPGFENVFHNEWATGKVFLFLKLVGQKHSDDFSCICSIKYERRSRPRHEIIHRPQMIE